MKRLTGLALLVVVSLPLSAWAQLGLPGGAQTVITVPGSVVSDLPVEQNTGGILSNTTGILAQDTLTATSVTTGGGAGLFQGQAPFLDAMMQTLASGIPDAPTYAALFQGWVDFGPSAAMLAATIANAIVKTDMNSLTVYQSLGQDFDAEDGALGAIEACNQAAGAAASVLYAIQCTNEAILNLTQHVQLLEVAQLVRGINEVVHRGYDFNADAQSGANMQAWLTQASQD